MSVHCNWCSHSVYGTRTAGDRRARWWTRSNGCSTATSPDMLWIADDVFTIHHGWIFEYAAEMKRRGIRIPFECITRADRLNRAHRRNCWRNSAACASGSARKAARSEFWTPCSAASRWSRCGDAVALCKQNGIQTGMFLMWGYEGEEHRRHRGHGRSREECRPDVFFTTVSYPIKGTPYFDKVAASW